MVTKQFVRTLLHKRANIIDDISYHFTGGPERETAARNKLDKQYAIVPGMTAGWYDPHEWERFEWLNKSARKLGYKSSAPYPYYPRSRSEMYAEANRLQQYIRDRSTQVSRDVAARNAKTSATSMASAKTTAGAPVNNTAVKQAPVQPAQPPMPTTPKESATQQVAQSPNQLPAIPKKSSAYSALAIAALQRLGLY